MPTPELLYTEVEDHIRQAGSATFEIGGVPITFDLSNRHERYYAASLLLDVRYPQGDIDRALFRRFVLEGDQVLDAGANIGVTALEILETGARRVVAAEPIPDLYSRLSALDTDAIISVDQAISSQLGHASMTVSVAHNQGSSLKGDVIAMFPTVFGEAPRKISVSTTTVDALCAEYGPFNVWKLDIEGAEVDAIAGGVETLINRPPRAIIAELYGDLRYRFKKILRETHPYGYRVFLRKVDYELEFASVDAEPTEAHHHTSPMFAFLQDPTV